MTTSPLVHNGTGLGLIGDRETVREETSALLAADLPELAFDSTLPRALVHRKSVAEVFVTDSREVSPGVFDVAGQLPRGHVMGERRELYDFPLVVEAFRQTGVVVAHRHYDVPFDQAFIMGRMSVGITDLDACRIGDLPARIVMRAQTEANTNRRGRLLGYDFASEATLDGVDALRATGALTFLSQRSYEVLRKRARAELDVEGAVVPDLTAAAPGAVGRLDPRNVVVTDPVITSERTSRSAVKADFSHPHLFDHPLDHIPGNLLIEAARQAAVATVSRLHGVTPASLVPVGVSAEFTGFVETDLVCGLEADAGELKRDARLGVPVVPVRVEAVQAGVGRSRFDLVVAQWV
ncbi:ScbA/BarX family gamma-butyrolactone biosynthesis protein [Streptomonospora wellingtoniae]|uniref:ScbA/BarX family gamma-butyrolactone biosynthesis protein n=1 Tax=Streptomonospora wellingtoniae TaxID=3075544 RepID=A0ABU2KSW4_9ACTN|nr:ScbA/BarX family gamma-butyrolactone biosynthesis protein [Streptomonospora sp. DSM 45055]MDT0302379.1 ScbA/BarX family gamma-butyrolactone biosynthesis protein [Streptomonospora sp. DSM 45055]